MSSNYISFAIFSLILIICLLACSFKTKKIEWLPFDRKHTMILKGMAILTVCWAHVGGKDYGIGGIQWIAGIGVCVFLICSGYGINESFKSNGLKRFWLKKISGIVIPYYLVYIIGGGILGTLNRAYLTDVLTLRGQWFIWYITICYAIYYLITVLELKLNLKDNTKLFILVLAFVIWFFVDTFFVAEGSNYMTRARQMLSFPLGAFVSYYKEEFIKVVKHRVVILISIAVGLGMMFVTNTAFVKHMSFLPQNIMSLFTVLPLAIAVIGTSVYYRKYLNLGAFYTIGIYCKRYNKTSTFRQ